MNRRVFENLGITVNLSKLPEYQIYRKAYLDKSRLVRFLLRTFLWTKIAKLSWDVRVAYLQKILEMGPHD